MKNSLLLKGLSAIALGWALVACQSKEIAVEDLPDQGKAPVFHAVMEQVSDPDSKVYVDEKLMVLWHADDRVSIFNKYTYNQQYRFDGQTGDNSGVFKKVESDDFVTGNSLPAIYAVYPYLESTTISNDCVLTMQLPATQSYSALSFGPGANTMVSATEDNNLLFKNLGGYLVFKLYGEGVTVSDVELKGNAGEKLAGKAYVTAPLDAAPSVEMAGSGSTELLTIECADGVALGATADAYTEFWFVLPPTTFSQGFTLTVTDEKGNTFEKSTTRSVTISRNRLSRMSPIEVVIEAVEPEEIIEFADAAIKADLVAAFDANGDGEISKTEAAAVTSLEGVFTQTGSQISYTSFDEFQYFTSVTTLAENSFYLWRKLKSITLPVSLKGIGSSSFIGCRALESMELPASVEWIDGYAFQDCTSLKQITLNEGLKSIGAFAFCSCSSLEEITLPESMLYFGTAVFTSCPRIERIKGKWASSDGRSLIIDNQLRMVAPYGLTQFEIPEGVTRIGYSAFARCSKLTAISIPESVTVLEGCAFSGCSSLQEVTIPAVTKIPFWTFRECSSLKRVDIPETVTSIGYDAFRYCSSLEAVYANPSTPPTGGDNMFDETNGCPIYVPDASVDAYKSAEYWSNYADRIKSESGGGDDPGEDPGDDPGEDPGDFDWNQTFYHRSLFMRFTATWCGYCPNMASFVKLAQEQNPGKIEALNLHGVSSNLYFSAGSTLESQFNITGYPSGVLDARRKVGNYSDKDYAASLIKKYVDETESNYPVSTAISYHSSYSGSTLNINLNLYVRKAGDYKVTAILMESGIVGYQADYYDSAHPDYVHNDIARVAISNISGDAFTTTADQTVKSFKYSVTVPDSYDKSQLRILVYVQRAFGSQTKISDYSGDYYVDNCASGVAGGNLAPTVMADGSGGTEDFGDGNPINW